jgi:rhodanese-related sulfurtransferase
MIAKALDQGEDLRIIDVREPDEYEEVHVRGVELFPLSRFRQGERPEKDDRPIAMICRSGSRSAKAAEILEEEGYGDVANISDGTLGAIEAGEEYVVRDDEAPDT